MRLHLPLPSSLIDPAVRMTDPLQRRNARMLAAVSLFLIPATVVLLALVFQLGGLTERELSYHLPQYLISTAIFGLCHVLARRGHTMYSAALLVSALILTFLLSGVPEQSGSAITVLIYLIVPVVLAAALGSVRVGIAVLCICTAGIVLMALAFPVYAAALLAGPGLALLVSGSLTLAVIWYLIQQERARQHELLASEQRISLLVKHIQEDVLICERDSGRVRYVTPHFLAQSDAALLGQAQASDALTRHMHAEDVEGFSRSFASFASTGFPRRAEYRWQSADGVYRWRETDFQDFTDPEGVACLITIARDIHERKMHEIEMAASEQRLRLVTDNLSTYIVMIEANSGTVRYLSNNMEQLLRGAGISDPKDLRARFWDTFIHPQDVQAANAALQDFLALGAPRRAEFRWSLTDSGWRWQESTFVAFTDTAGAPCVLITTHDIHERKSNELALANERSRLRTVIDAIPDAIYIKDASGALRMSNIAHVRALGRASEAEMIGLTAHDLFPPDVADRLQAMDAQVLRDGQPVTGVHVDLPGPDGMRKLVFSKVPIYDDTQRIAALVCQMRDVTEIVRLQREQQASAALQLALEKERTLNQLKMNFMVTVSHEFRTPLATILTASQIIDHYGARMPEEGRLARLRSIQHEAVHLSRMLDDIRVMLSLQNNEIQPQPEPIATHEFMHMLIQSVQQQAAPHDIQLTIATGCEQVQADRELLRQIVRNLLENALRVSPADAPVELTMDREGTDVRIDILDRGPGVDPARVERIFQPFERADSEAQPGTGLGLTIAQHCAQLCGGSVAYSSRPQGGACFSVHLPGASAPAPG